MIVQETPPIKARQPQHVESLSVFSTVRRYSAFLVRGVEKWAVVVLFLAMMVLPSAESLARLCKTTIPGAVLYSQHLTLWVGFLGALLATTLGKHLSLATGELIPAGRVRESAQIYVGGLCAGTCALLAYASAVLVQADSVMERDLPGGIPEWWSELIMPVALGMMALRFSWRASPRGWGKVLALVLAGAMVGMGAWASQAETMLLPGVVAILVGVVLGAPLFIGMAGLAMLLFFADGVSIAAVPTETYRLVASSTLPAIPLLTAAGYIFAEGGASKRFLRLARALIGWAPGSMALMVVLLCTGFTTITGGSGVTILAMGGLVLPMLVSEKYSEDFSLGLVTSSSSLGLLFFPSLPVILYAVVAGESPSDLFAAGLIPGLLMMVLIAIWGVVTGIRQKAPRQPFSLPELGSALWEAKWEVLIPIFLYSLFLGGITTIIETAALALLAAMVTQSLVFRDLHWRSQLPETMARAGVLVGAVVVLLGVAMGLTSYLVDAEIPALVLDWTKSHIHSPVVFLLVLNGLLLVLGSVLEIYSAIIVLAPLLTPLAAAYGINPLHLGIVFLANLELGFLFPPMGLNLILSSSRFNQPLVRLYRVTLPFMAILAIGVLLITYIPAMTVGMSKQSEKSTDQPKRLAE